MRMFEKSSGTFAAFLNGGWELGIVRGSALFVDGQQVIGPRSEAIGSPCARAVVDSEARAAINDILNTLRRHGLIAA
jgi:hypothetical protein